MPLYEYQCLACGRRVEKIQKVTAPETETCACGGKMQRLLSAPAIQFKGTGWYITDYAHKSGMPANGGEGKAGEGQTGGGKPGEGKASEAKPESANGAAKPASDGKPAAPAPAAPSTSK